MRSNLLIQKSKFDLRNPLVRTSATYWLEGMYKMHMLPLSSLWCRSISTCSVISCWIGLLAILIGALLSHKSFNGVSPSWWRSDKTFWSQIFSHIPKLMAFWLNATSGHNTLLLTPPSYKIASNKGTIIKGRFFVNNKSCLAQVSVCLNGLFICLSKHQPFTRCFQISQNSVDSFHVFLIRNLHKLADNTHSKGNIRTSMG